MCMQKCEKPLLIRNKAYRTEVLMFSSIATNLLLLRFKRSLLKSASITSCRVTSILTSPRSETINRNGNYTTHQPANVKTSYYCKKSSAELNSWGEEAFMWNRAIISDSPYNKVFMTRILLVGPCPISLNPFTSISYLVWGTTLRKASVKLLVTFTSLYSFVLSRLYFIL